MQYFSVKNWEKFQHYKDRNPPWIKLHKEVLDDYEMSMLQDASKLLLILLWVLASQLNNRIPNDPDWLQKRLSVHTKINIKELIDKGYLILEQNDSNVLAKCSPETEAYREETEVERVEVKLVSKKITIDQLSVSHVSDWLNEKRSKGQYLNHDPDFILEKFKDYCRAKGKKYSDYIAAYRNSFDWQSCQPKNNNGGMNGGYYGQPKKSKFERAAAAVAEAGALREQTGAESA